MDIDDNAHPHYLIDLCYLTLLQIPHNIPLRLRSQSAMARCVHYLAVHYGRDPEELQNEYERIAREIANPSVDP